jgi:molecular chaperone IbpA
MRSFDLDLSPLFRSTVGFDRLGRMLESAREGNGAAPSYPPYNIEKLDEDAYRIVMAVAGFGEDDLDVSVENETLTVTGKGRESEEQVRYLHRGIAGRAFQRQFKLADHIRVDGARLENGLLVVDLVREIPEALKPRTIQIQSKAAAIEHDKAA